MQLQSGKKTSKFKRTNDVALVGIVAVVSLGGAACRKALDYIAPVVLPPRSLTACSSLPPEGAALFLGAALRKTVAKSARFAGVLFNCVRGWHAGKLRLRRRR